MTEAQLFFNAGWPSWYSEKKCGPENINDFFAPGSKGRISKTYLQAVARAKAICATCPVIEPCSEMALEHERNRVPKDSRLEGVWGGLSLEDRINQVYQEFAAKGIVRSQVGRKAKQVLEVQSNGNAS